MGRDDGGYQTPYIDVDIDSMRDAALELQKIGNRLDEVVDHLMEAAALPLNGLPGDADVYRAYSFWWGRWSAVAESAEAAVRSAAQVASLALDGFAYVDEQGKIELVLPEG